MNSRPLSQRSNATELSLANVAEARSVIPREFLDTPQFEEHQLNSALGRRVTVKVESLNPLRSFKGRGVGFALRDLSLGDTVVCSSSGNFGQAVAYVGAARGATVRIYAPAGVNPVKRDRMRAFGAEVIEVSGGFQVAREEAANEAAAGGFRLIVDGVDAGVAEGAATIAEELTRGEDFETLIAPIGDGSLISGLALWTRTYSPRTRIIGVNPSSAPAMHNSWHVGRPVSVMPENGFAEGITIPCPHPEAFERIRHFVDDIVTVDDDELRSAMELTATHLSLLAEPAGAAGIAAIAAGRVSGNRVATIITGSNRNPNMPASAGSAGREQA